MKNKETVEIEKMAETLASLYNRGQCGSSPSIKASSPGIQALARHACIPWVIDGVIRYSELSSIELLDYLKGIILRASKFFKQFLSMDTNSSDISNLIDLGSNLSLQWFYNSISPDLDSAFEELKKRINLRKGFNLSKPCTELENQWQQYSRKALGFINLNTPWESAFLDADALSDVVNSLSVFAIIDCDQISDENLNAKHGISIEQTNLTVNVIVEEQRDLAKAITVNDIAKKPIKTQKSNQNIVRAPGPVDLALYRFLANEPLTQPGEVGLKHRIIIEKAGVNSTSAKRNLSILTGRELLEKTPTGSRLTALGKEFVDKMVKKWGG